MQQNIISKPQTGVSYESPDPFLVFNLINFNMALDRMFFLKIVPLFQILRI